jgi:endonuclease I
MKTLFSFLLALLFLSLSSFGTIPPGYYDPANGLTGAALKTSLFNIIKGHTRKSYDYLWTAFYTTDDKPNGTVWDIYSDIPNGTPNGNPPYVYNFGTNQCANTPGYENGCYNREHSFPKSYMASIEGDTTYTDLFHMYPTDSYVNTRRNNYPYGQVSSPTWTSMNGSKLGPCTATGYTGIVFEPRDDFKGDLARTYFYMATRYETRIASWALLDPYGDAIMNGTAYPCYETWFINMLLAWNAADPVSQKEIDRNNDVYTIQHNRNPFIDHPEYAEAIWNPGAGVLPEPTNYPENFSAHNIHLQWIDATGTTLPDGYLIRMSTVGFNAIQTPVDGTPVLNSSIDKNVLYGIQEAWFTNLTPNTIYYFTMYSYSGTGSDINYKTDGVIPQVQQTPKE